MAHPISKCDSCSFLKINSEHAVDNSTCHNLTTPVLVQCCAPGITCNQVYLLSFNISDMFAWCLEQNGASLPKGVIPQNNCHHIYKIEENKIYPNFGSQNNLLTRQDSAPFVTFNSPDDCVNEGIGWI